MSYDEYNDMYFNCQKTAPYKMYAYDVVDSKCLYDINLCNNLYTLINLVMYKIGLIEKQMDRRILYNGTDLIYDKNKVFDLNRLEPMLLGDAIAFTVYRDAISDGVVDSIFEQCKAELHIKYDFHKTSGYYETNNWIEGQDKYFRGYCFQYLTNKHKNRKKL
jgi:hypothetical protein